MHPCRICGNKELRRFLSLGPTPLANNFLKEDELRIPEAVYPLDVCFCNTCGLVQLADVVPKEILFRDYIYVSSTSDTIPTHFSHLAEEVTERFLPATGAFVVELGSNDGCLLRCFPRPRVETLGVEPATNIAQQAAAAGIETINEFFSPTTALAIREQRGKAHAILGTNVFAHIDNLEDFMQGVDALLDDAGVIVLEFPYLVDLLVKTEYDTIYHEHLSYFSLRPVVHLFRSWAMEIFDVKRTQVHGGSLRVYGKRTSGTCSTSPEIASLLALERELHLDSYETYLCFAEKVHLSRESLVHLLRRLREKANNIVGYGAPAKGNVLLNFCQIDGHILDYIVDKSPHKQGLYTPGRHIPVHPVERLLVDQPDYVLLLAWNFADEILKQQSEYSVRGGKFIRPIPTAEILQSLGAPASTANPSS